MKIALCVTHHRNDCEDVVDRMTRVMQVSEQNERRIMRVPGGAIGCVTTSDQASPVRMIRLSQAGNLLALTGVPIQLDGSLDARLDRVLHADYRQAAQSLCELDGAFAGLMWDAQNGKLVVVTDFLGVQPLYMVHRDGLLLLATDLKAMSASGLVNVEMEPATWGAFITFGHSIGDGTQLAGVKRVGPACSLVYDPVDGSLETSTHWQWPAEQADLTLEKLDTEPLVDSMKREIRAYGEHTTKSTVLLSGGFDSRFLLALVREEGLDAPALAVTHKDELWDTDGRLATAAARRLGVPHKIVTPTRSFFGSKAFLEYLVMSEVACPSLYLFIAQVCDYLHTEMRAVWEGVAPGMVLHPYPVPPTLHGFIEKSMGSRDSVPWRAALQVFGRTRMEQMHVALSESVRAASAPYPNDVSGIYQFKTGNYMRNRLAQVPLKVYANRVLPLTPGFSRQFWGTAAAIPPTVRIDAKTYMELFRRHFPRAGEIPFLSGDKLFCNGSRGPRRWRASVPYYLSRSQPVRLARRARRKLRGTESSYWAESPLPDYVLDKIDLDHPDLDADGIRGLKRKTPPYDLETILARHLTFHWQAWRWVMEGHLTMENAADFAQQCADRNRAVADGRANTDSATSHGETS